MIGLSHSRKYTVNVAVSHVTYAILFVGLLLFESQRMRWKSSLTRMRTGETLMSFRRCPNTNLFDAFSPKFRQNSRRGMSPTVTKPLLRLLLHPLGSRVCIPIFARPVWPSRQLFPIHHLTPDLLYQRPTPRCHRSLRKCIHPMERLSKFHQ